MSVRFGGGGVQRKGCGLFLVGNATEYIAVPSLEYVGGCVERVVVSRELKVGC